MHQFNLGFSNVFFFLLLMLVLVILRWDHKSKKQFLARFRANITVASSLPIIGSVLLIEDRKNFFESINKIRKRLQTSSFVWYHLIWPYYVTEDADDFKAVLPHHLERGAIYNLVADDICHRSLFDSKVSSWKINRKNLNRSFRQTQVSRMITEFIEMAEEHLETFSPKENSISLFHKNAGLYYKSTYVNLVNLPRNYIDSTPFDIHNMISSMTELLFQRIFSPWLYLDFTNQFTSTKRHLNKQKKILHGFYHTVFNDLRTQRKEIEEAEIENFVINLDKSNVEQEVIFAEMSLLSGASIDTTSFTYSMVLILLGMYQDVQDKVLEEILEVVGPHSAVTYHQLPSLKYIDMVVDECLRLFPAVPFLFRKIHEDINVGDRTLPKDLDIMFNIAALHRNEKYWENPSQFNPDRFKPEEIKKRHPYSFLPFSTGARNCIGYKYAKLSLVAVIALTIRKYKMWCSYTSLDEIKVNSCISMRMNEDENFSCTFTVRNKSN